MIKMKARVKETGCVYDFIKIDHMNFRRKLDGEIYCGSEIDFIDDYAQDDPDYWTRLEHQYAGIAMQGMLANHYITDRIDVSVLITEAASSIAHALVEKLKESK